jgi:hypothetical protein
VEFQFFCKIFETRVKGAAGGGGLTIQFSNLKTMVRVKIVRISRQQRELKKLETGLRGWNTIVPCATKKEVKPAPAAVESSSDDDVEIVECPVIPGRLALCKFCSIPCLTTVEHRAMCERCIALPPADRRFEDWILEICEACKKSFTYCDYPGRPFKGLIYCSDCRKPQQ